MIATALRPLDRVLERLDRVRPSGQGYSARCPAHEDRVASLSVREGDDGTVLVKCHAGCPLEAIAAALGLTVGDLFAAPASGFPAAGNGHTPPRAIAETDYPIHDAAGALQAIHRRIDYADGTKQLLWVRPDGRTFGLGGRPMATLPLYGAETLRDRPGEDAILCEGEKAAQALRDAGALALGTVTGAAGTPADAVLAVLRGRLVSLWPDNDDAGRDHMARVAAGLARLGIAHRVIPWPDAPEKGDAADFLAAGGDLAALLAAAAVPSPAPPGPARAGFALTRLDALLAEPDEDAAYVVAGLLPAGGVSLLVAKPKAGKSVFSRVCGLCVARGAPFFGRETTGGPAVVLYLCFEEKRAEVRAHFRRMGAGAESLYAHIGPVPRDGVDALAALVAAHAPALVIVDPLQRLARLRDVNDYAEVSAKMEPFIDLARASGCHILCVHHAGKLERDGGDGVLGSTGFFAGVDTLLEMRREKDGRRTIQTVQRYGDDLPQTVVALDRETGLVAPAGAVEEVARAAAVERVVAALGGDTLTEEDIAARAGGDTGRMGQALRRAVEQGRVVRSGVGKRGQPYRYTAAPVAD